MQQINFDSGIRKFQINGGGVLSFNPSDLNVYNRFLEASEKIKKVEEDLVAKGKELGEAFTGADAVRLLAESDQEIKKFLQYIFGQQNDFDEIFGGVNILSVADNGERVITNFLAAIAPYLEKGARSFAKQKATTAKNGMNRAQRRAQK